MGVSSAAGQSIETHDLWVSNTQLITVWPSDADAKLVGEDDFPVHFHQGQRDNLHITLVSTRIILVVVFDDRSSLGLVRLRVKKAGAELAKVFEEIQKKAEQANADGGSGTPFSEITDEDIDNLFSV